MNLTNLKTSKHDFATMAEPIGFDQFMQPEPPRRRLIEPNEDFPFGITYKPVPDGKGGFNWIKDEKYV